MSNTWLFFRNFPLLILLFGLLLFVLSFISTSKKWELRAWGMYSLLAGGLLYLISFTLCSA
ncbi:MAG: hypothetical protein R2800_05215 [Flavipsychrobacter sp.]